MKILSLLFSVLIVSCSSTGSFSTHKQGKKLFKTTFNPELNFLGELVENSDDQLLMTVVTSRRDDYLPDYSLAIALQFLPSKDESYRGVYSARMLRMKPTDEPFGISDDINDFDWLETDLLECDGAMDAMEDVRKSNWQPDVHYTLLDVDDLEVILHPAMIRVSMTGNYTTTTYEGWRLAHGTPAAVRVLVSKLQPCWKPSESIPPWEK